MTAWIPGGSRGRDANVRRFTEQPDSDEALDRILEAGRRAPSAGNWQPWDFVLVTDSVQLVELAKVGQGAGHVAGAAAAIAIVAPEPQDDQQSALLQYDLGQATFAMTVARPTWASVQVMLRPPTRDGPGQFWGSPRGVSWPASSPSVSVGQALVVSSG